jgi:HlyD family secretion protein
VLIRLDRTQSAARHDALLHQSQSLRAAEARLVAERDDRDRIAFGEELESRRGEPRVADILAGQESIFETRRRSYQGQIEILEQRIEQLRSEIVGLRAQVASVEIPRMAASEGDPAPFQHARQGQKARNVDGASRDTAFWGLRPAFGER